MENTMLKITETKFNFDSYRNDFASDAEYFEELETRYIDAESVEERLYYLGRISATWNDKNGEEVFNSFLDGLMDGCGLKELNITQTKDEDNQTFTRTEFKYNHE